MHDWKYLYKNTLYHYTHLPMYTRTYEGWLVCSHSICLSLSHTQAQCVYVNHNHKLLHLPGSQSAGHRPHTVGRPDLGQTGNGWAGRIH